MHQSRKQYGLIVTDMMVGLAIVSLLATILAVTLGYEKRAVRAADQQQHLAVQAEQVLVSMQSGTPVPEIELPQQLHVTPVEAPTGTTAAGLAWVRVEVTRGPQSASLVGVVPESAATAYGATYE